MNESDFSYLDVPGETVVASGADVPDLLQRISTNDIAPLRDGKPVTTGFLSEKGRVIEIATAVPSGTAEAYLLLTHGISAGSFIERLRSFIIMEDAAVEYASTEVSHLLLFRTDTPESIASVPEASIPDAFAVCSERVVAGSAWTRAAIERSRRDEFVQALGVAGGRRITEVEWRAVRTSLGIPAPGREIGDERNPLEAGIRPIVDFRKGCYVGQEVVARLDSYQKVSKVLARLAGSGPAYEGDALVSEGKEVGELTSVSPGPSDTWSALGFIRERGVSAPLALSSRPTSIVTLRETDPFRKAYA